MSLAIALSNARSSLLTTAKQIAVSGRNIASADDPGYTRKIAQPTTGGNGSVAILAITRATDLGLIQRVLAANSSATGQQAVLDGLDRLQETIGDTSSDTSPAARMATLASALQTQLNSPADRSLAQVTVAAAQSVVTSLANATSTVMSIRIDADAGMVTSVGRVNDLLGQLTTLNAAAVRGTFSGEDVTPLLDQRDAVIARLSEEIGITTVQRANNDIAVYTESGVPLFDKTARTVAFDASSALAPGAVGNAVFIDGVPVTGANATMAIHTGTLSGLATLRDEIAPTYQAQLDEMARGLIESFAESDQSGGGGPDLAGQFTYLGGPGLPATGTLMSGLAGSIRVNPAVIPSQGGSFDRVRDGGINGAAYQYNPTAAASFPDRLDQLIDQLSAVRIFDAQSAVEADASVLDFGTASISWLEDLRQTTSTAVEYQNTLLTHASEALSNASGVNMDDEYAKQLQLEQSYMASSKLIGIINQIFDTLFSALD
jgi:flagellar hook-associated protein 1 FlgK